MPYFEVELEFKSSHIFDVEADNQDAAEKIARKQFEDLHKGALSLAEWDIFEVWISKPNQQRIRGEKNE